MKSRAQKITLTKNSPYAFRKKIVCGDCQSLFRRKVVRGITYWVCIGHDKKRHGLKCGITPIAEDEITNAFIRLLKEKRALIEEQRQSNAQAVRRIEDAAAAMAQASTHISEWDEALIRQLVDTVKVNSAEKITVFLRGGVQVEQGMI